MLGEGHPVVQGAGYILRAQTFRLQPSERCISSGGKVFPKHPDPIAPRARIFSRRILRYRISIVRQGTCFTWDAMMQLHPSRELYVLFLPSRLEQTIHLPWLGVRTHRCIHPAAPDRISHCIHSGQEAIPTGQLDSELTGAKVSRRQCAPDRRSVPSEKCQSDRPGENFQVL